MKGIPTPDEEALQEPTIDPVFFGSLGMTAGPMVAGKQLFGQMIQDYLMRGLGEGFNRVSQYLPPISGKVADFGYAITKAASTQDSGMPDDYAERIRQMWNVHKGRELTYPFGSPHEELSDRTMRRFSDIIEGVLKSPELRSAEQRAKNSKIPKEIFDVLKVPE